jgi:hypothetical protein
MSGIDTELVIRARDEASKAAEAITTALLELKGAQDGVGKSASNTDGLLGKLGKALNELQAEAKGFEAYTKLTAQLDKAADAVTRLEGQVRSTTAEQAKLSAQIEKAAEDHGRLAAAVDATKAAYDREKAATAAMAAELNGINRETRAAENSYARLYTRVTEGKAPSDKLKESLRGQRDVLISLLERQDQATVATKAQRDATQSASVAYREAKAALSSATQNQAALVKASDASAASLQRQNTALAGAQAAFGEIFQVATAAGVALGGVAARQDEVAAASRRAAADAAKVSEALERQSGITPASSGSGAPAAAATAAYREQVAAVGQARAAFQEAKQAATDLGRQMAQTSAPTRELETAFLLAQEAAHRAEAAYIAEGTALNRLKGISQGTVTEFLRQINTTRQTAAAVEDLGGAVDRAGKVAAKANTRKGEIGFLGLRPYELQNLGYQVNDVITQLASGTSVTQTFAQQGGQILQLFPRLLSGAAGVLPELIGVAVALGSVFLAMKQVGDLKASEREFTGKLTATADAARYDAKAMAEAAHGLDLYGTSLKIARQEVATFLANGVDVTQMERFGKSAQNMADLMGIKVPDAAKQTAEAFTRGYESIKKLDDELNFLSAAERQHINDLFDSGHASDARTYAFQRFEQRMDEGARKARGPWASAIRDLGGAWDSFLHFLSNSAPIRTMMEWLEGLAKKAKEVAASLPGAKSKTDGTENPFLKRLKSHREELLDEQAVADARENGGMPRRGSITQAARPLAEVNRELAAVNKSIAAANKAAADTVAAGSQRGTKAGQDIVKELQDEHDSLKGINDQKRIQIAGEKEYNKVIEAHGSQEEAQKARKLGEDNMRYRVNKENAANAHRAESRADALQNKVDTAEKELTSLEVAMDKKIAEGQTASLDQRMAAIDDEAQKVRDQIKKFKELGGENIGDESPDQYSARLEANVTLLKQQETLKFYEESMRDLEKERDERLKSIGDRYSANLITAQDALAEQNKVGEEMRVKLADLATLAEDFALKMKGAKPDPKLEAFIEKMDRIRFAPSAGPETAAAKNETPIVAAEEKKLNDIIADRKALLDINNTLFDQGVISIEEWRRRSKEAYTETTPDILKQVAAVRALVEALHAQHAITDVAYDAWKAKLKLAEAETQNFAKQEVLTAKQANTMLADAGVNGIESFIQKVSAGRKVIQAFGESFLETIASVLHQVAKLILTQLLLNAIMKNGLGKWLSGKTNSLVDTGGLVAGAAALAGAGIIIKQAASDLMNAAIALAAANAAGSFGVHHSGGMAGSPRRTRSAMPGLFAGAMRLHTGGMPGLGPNEVPTILLKNEEVLTRSDPRHVLNGGKSGGGGGGLNLKTVNIFDPAELLQHALGSQAGERVLVNWVRNNQRTFKAALG